MHQWLVLVEFVGHKGLSHQLGCWGCTLAWLKTLHISVSYVSMWKEWISPCSPEWGVCALTMFALTMLECQHWVSPICVYNLEGITNTMMYQWRSIGNPMNNNSIQIEKSSVMLSLTAGVLSPVSMSHSLSKNLVIIHEGLGSGSSRFSRISLSTIAAGSLLTPKSSTGAGWFNVNTIYCQIDSCPVMT